MSIAIETDPTGSTVLVFTLAADAHDGEISLVGSFNDWTPGIDVLVPTSDGRRVARITAAPGQELHFRYLGSGGVWFDDSEAEHTESGSLVRVPDALAQGAVPEELAPEELAPEDAVPEDAVPQAILTPVAAATPIAKPRAAGSGRRSAGPKAAR